MWYPTKNLTLGKASTNHSGLSAGMVLLRDWGCILCFTRGRLVHVQWLSGKDYIGRQEGETVVAPAIFFGARLHGLRTLKRLDEEIVRPSLRTVALGWQLWHFRSDRTVSLPEIGSIFKLLPFWLSFMFALHQQSVLSFIWQGSDLRQP